MANQSVHRTVIGMVLVVPLMFAFVFVVMVPLYNTFCEALGLNGKTRGQVQYETVAAAVDESRMIKVQFVASNAAGMPWKFKPTETVMQVHPGAVSSTAFHVRNPTDQAMVSQSVPSIVPARAAAHFHKTECFCFNQQPLAAGGEAEMPLQFIIDQDLPRDIKTITLSYTIFDVTDMTTRSGAVAAR